MTEHERRRLVAGTDVRGGRLASPAWFGSYLLTVKVASDRVATCFRAQRPDGDQQPQEVLIRVLHDHLGEDSRHREQFLAQGRAGMALGTAAEIAVLEVGEAEGMCFWVVELEAGMRRALVPEPRPEWRPLERWLPTS